MRIDISLRNKIFFIFIVVLLLGIGSIGWIGYTNTYESYLKSSNELSVEDVSSIKLSIESKLDSVPNDINFLTENYALKRYMIWKSMSVAKKSQKWKTIFSDILKDFLETRENYRSVRIIDLKGNELIAATYDSFTDHVTIKPENRLQNKSGRDYVEVTKKLKKGEFYISKMNLNIENGKIEKPYIPVVRYATPMYDGNNEVVGVLVANIYAKKILNIIAKNEDRNKKKKISYDLINNKGEYLYNKDSKKCWGNQLKSGYNFYKEYPDVQKNIKGDNGIFNANGKVYTFHKIHPLLEIKDNYWYVISIVDESVSLSKLESFTLMFSTIVILIILLSFIVIRYYLNMIIVPLSQVTEQLKALSKGHIKKMDIVYNAHDEIGEIVYSTSKVVDAISTTITQANAVANGNFTKDIELLSKDDKLGLAITDMTKRLKEISVFAQKLSTGNYKTKIIAKSSDDVLGLALIDTISYLETVTEIAESIARGEIDIEYKTVGDDDRLGVAMLKMISYLKTILHQSNAIAKNDFSNKIIAKSSKDELSIALGTMTKILKENNQKTQNDIYFNEGISAYSEKVSGIIDTNKLAKEVITTASRYVDASSGVVYIFDEEHKLLKLIASFSFNTREALSNVFSLGESVIGQVALEKEAILLRNLEDSSTEIHTGTTIAKSKEVYVLPLVHEGELLGVIEFMTTNIFTKLQKGYLEKVAILAATSLYSTSQNVRIKVLLEKSQSAFEELQVQSEELQESNVQMEEQQQQLSLQALEMKKQNSELTQAKEDLDKRANDLEKASQYKSEFLANMSHELRTPLNSIILLSKLLTQNQNGHLEKDDVSKTEVIYKAGNDLLLLINDILDLSKIESGNMELQTEEIVSSDISTEIHGLFDEVAKDKKISFEIEDQINSTFLADKTKLLQILKNLLSNAFKFTKEGGVVMSMLKDEKNLIFEVKDSGIGIPSSKLELIFDAFKQVDGSISREYGGTGLGLSISKTFVDLMGGVIEVESVSGEGSTFRVLLPLKQEKLLSPMIKKSQVSEVLTLEEEPQFVIENEEELDSELLNGKNILIVDDDSRNIFTLSSVLQELGAETFSALNGKDAIDLLINESEDMDMILMDIMMPVMDGLEVMKVIKKDKRFKEIPIIAITAKTMQQDKEMCFEAGADDYLPKPIDQNALVSILKAWSK